jgi:hypothetical protein
MLAARLMKDKHALSDNTFIVVHVVIAQISSLSILFNYIVLNFVINFLETTCQNLPPLGVTDCPVKIL